MPAISSRDLHPSPSPSYSFYEDAKRDFFKYVFPSNYRPQERHELIRLTQIAVMLTHFQCMNICEEQAYMMCMFGLAFAKRCLTGGDSLSHENVALFRVVEGWAVWLTFYLRRTDNPPSLTIEKTEEFVGVNLQATWAVGILSRYTLFLHYLNTKVMESDVHFDHLKVDRWGGGV